MFLQTLRLIMFAMTSVRFLNEDLNEITLVIQNVSLAVVVCYANFRKSFVTPVPSYEQ